jgi:hypothetical protein
VIPANGAPASSGRHAFDGPRRRAEFGLDHQAVTGHGQRVANVGELGLLAFGLAIEPRLRIGGRSVRPTGPRRSNALRDLNIAPNTRTTRHLGYAISQQKRKRTEEPFGWAERIGGLTRPMLPAVARLRFKFPLMMAPYDLTRLPKLLAPA